MERKSKIHPRELEELRGPFDIVGDVHGCFDELCSLLQRLGYETGLENTSAASGIGDSVSTWRAKEEHWVARHPEDRTLVFVGDLGDRGPRSADVFSLAIGTMAASRCLWVAGNHDVKLSRFLKGKGGPGSHGLAMTAADFDDRMKDWDPEDQEQAKLELASFIADLPHHLVLDRWGLLVAHAGLPEENHGKDTPKVRSICHYGVTTGEKSADGFPVREDWAADYAGEPLVVYGHTVVGSAEFRNNTVCLDTGCVFGGRLTALRYPEREIVSVAAEEVHWAPKPSTARILKGRL